MELPSREDLPWPVRKIVDGWMVVVRAFSWLMARIVIAVLFVVAFLPYRLYLIVSRKDPLDEELDPDATTYWQANQIDNRTLEDFQRQY